MSRPTTPRRLVLVGFMGSGKSTVGRLVAGALGWTFVDLDERVEADQGRSIGEIFEVLGEPHFRAIEARLAQESLAGDALVLAVGGGWAAEPGRLEALPDGTLTVWLDVSAEEALRRVEGAPTARPLLDGADRSDRMERARALMRARAPRYALADLKVDTEGRTPEDVRDRILALLERRPTNHRGGEVTTA